MNRPLTDAEVNHLRRLIGWVASEIGQTPDEFVATLKAIAPAVGAVGEDGKARLTASYEKAADVPKYIRAAVKALRKAVDEKYGEIQEGELAEQRAASAAALPFNNEVLRIDYQARRVGD